MNRIGTVLIGAMGFMLSAPAAAVTLRDCESVVGVTQRLSCLHANTVTLNSAFESVTRELRAAVQQSAIPQGTVASFDLDTCPRGWREFKDGRGRVVIGVNPSAPSAPPGRGENGLTARKRGDADTGGEMVTLVAANLPPHSHRTAAIETMQVLGHFQGHPAYTVTGRDSGTSTRIPVEAAESVGSVQPINNMPPFVVLLQCEKD